MLALVGAIACSALFGCEARAMENSVEIGNYTAVSQNQRLGNPSGSPAVSGELSGAATAGLRSRFNPETAAGSIDPALAAMVPGLVPIRTCDARDINEISYDNSRRILKSLDGKPSRKLELALRQNRAFVDFVRQMCPQNPDIEAWIRLSEDNFRKDSALSARYRQQENAALSGAGPARVTGAVSAPQPDRTRAIQEPVALPRPVPVVLAPPPAVQVPTVVDAPLSRDFALLETVRPPQPPAHVVEPVATGRVFTVMQPVTDDVPAYQAGIDAKGGWVYLGARVDGEWKGRHFRWPGDLPENGTPLKATGSVNIRTDYIRYSKETGLSSPKVIGAVAPGQKVVAHQIVETSPGHYWAKIQ